jgi:hypothetical protein
VLKKVHEAWITVEWKGASEEIDGRSQGLFATSE